MGRLIDEDILIDSIPDLSAFEQEEFGTSDMIRLIEDAPTVEAIPKDQYEARLKADMVAMLEVIKLRIDSLPEPLNRYRVNYCIQEKINALKADRSEEDGKS